MEKYENQGLVGEGSYGMVLKCKHKETGQLVAIKKFLESEDDKMVKKIALREVRMLKQLRHDNLVNLLEVFRRKKKLYLVFEFVDHTVLDELEKCPNGLDETTCRKILWQVLKGIEFCHMNNIIHRDIKPENILVSKNGVVKLCDFGFARTIAQPGEIYTDYVATRWYRAPELLVGDTKYGKAVDIWAVGCLLVEMLTGEPLFPGDSDIDQLYHIVKVFGNLTAQHKEVFLRNPLFVGMRIPEVREVTPLEKKFPRMSSQSLNLIKECLKLDPDDRPTCSQLIKHDFFTRDGFAQKFSHDLKAKMTKEHEKTALLQSIVNEKDDDDKDNNKTTTKKKKKPLLVRKDTKVDADHNKSNTKGDGNKMNSKERTRPFQESKANTDDKSKQKTDLSDKGAVSKKTPPTTTNTTNQNLDNRSKTQTSLTNSNGLSGTPVGKTPEKMDQKDKQVTHKPTYKPDTKAPVDKLDTKSEKADRDSGEKTDREKTKLEKLDKGDSKDKDGDNRNDSKSEIHPDRKAYNESRLDQNNDKDDQKSREDQKCERENSRYEKESTKFERESTKHEKRGSDKSEADKEESMEYKERDKENISSYKDLSSIPPIHSLGYSMHNSNTTTPSIPSLSSPNQASATNSPYIFAPAVNNVSVQSPRGALPYTGVMSLSQKDASRQQAWVSDKMTKKPGLKKAIPNHHSIVISPQPIQSEKSHLHDKSLEKLRTQRRETTMFDPKRDKEMIMFPEVKGAEAAPLKLKPKSQLAPRSNVATIPHITNIDPFPSSSQVETHSTEKGENNLPSV